MITVDLSQEAYEVLCGLVQPSEEVDPSGIVTEAWPELRATFPIGTFRSAVDRRGTDLYVSPEIAEWRERHPGWQCPHCGADRGDGYCQECGGDRDE